MSDLIDKDGDAFACLVGDLRNVFKVSPHIGKRAADTIESQAKRIAELEAERDAMKVQLDCIMKWATYDEYLPQTDIDEGYEAARRWVLEVGLCALPKPAAAKEQQ